MPEDLTKGQLDFGYWFLTHKAQLKKMLTAVIIVVNVALWGYVIYGLTFYFVEYSAQAASLAEWPAEWVDYASYRSGSPAYLPDVLSETAISSGTGTYDLVAEADNPSDLWAIPYLEYRFTWSGGETDFKPGFILPGEKKFFLDLNVPGSPADASIEFRNVRHLRMNAKRELPAGSDLGFSMANISFVPAGSEPLAGGKLVPSSKVTFDAANDTPYNFWSVRFKAILYQGKRIAAANVIPAEQFLSGETRALEMNWFQKLPQITGVIIEPEVNYLDKGVFMPIR